MKIKVCGMKYPDNIAAIQNCAPDFMGFIFYTKSPRIVIDKTLEAEQNLKGNPPTVGVFVDSPIEEVLERIAEYKLNFVQLHGKESVSYVEKLSAEGIQIIKTFQIDADFEWESVKAFAPFVSYFLFDTATQNYGGSGLKFDWNQLKNYAGKIPFFLSGGISIDDLQAIKKLDLPQLYAIDINSKFETKPGVKDEALVTEMINSLRHEKYVSSK